ncbi:MAG TPA: type IX secretion system membrane protein PorP/SprF [Cyclobacteriaceae bacterium]
MRRLLLVCVVFGSFQSLFAQQDPLYAQYLLNPMVINPAYAGLNNNFNGSVAYRKQWAGFDGSPTTFNVNGHMSMFDNKVGAGVLLVQDQLGITKNTEFQGAFSYKLQLKDNVLSFGMQGGFINFRNNTSNLTLDDPTDPVYVQNANVVKPNVGAGVILKSERFIVGLSVPRMLPTKISDGGTEFQLYQQHFYLFGSYVFYLNERLRFKPSALLRGVKGSPLSTDLNFNIIVDGNYTGGIFTRNFNTYGLLVQALISKKFKLGYIFEVPTSSSVGVNYSTHEVFLGLILPVLKSHERSISNF